MNDTTVRRCVSVATLVLLAFAGPALAEERGTVAWIIDGDTLRVRIHGQAETVRLIGVDAPETGGFRSAESFHRQATAFMIRLAKGRRVRLMGDPITGDRDRYGRLLRYVWTPDGRMLNAEIIAAGWARAMRHFRYARQAEFLALERTARRERRGRWAVASRK